MVLASYGLQCSFTPVPIRADDEEWEGVANRYWHFGTYFLPKVTWVEEPVPDSGPNATAS